MCLESYLNPHTALEDIDLPDEVETYHGAVKHIAQKVTELIGEELVKQGGLEGLAVCWVCERNERKYSFVFPNQLFGCSQAPWG